VLSVDCEVVDVVDELVMLVVLVAVDDNGKWQVHSISDVAPPASETSSSQFTRNLTSQLSSSSSAAATQTCPKLSQYKSHRPE